MSTKKLKVAICGGGIGGLTCAVMLSRCADIDVEIYEAAAEFTEVGAGIGVWPRVWRILEKLGLAEDFARVTAVKPTYDKSDAFIFRKADQPQGVDFYQLVTQGSFLRYHRPDVLQVLVSHVGPSCRIHYSTRLQSYTRTLSGTVELTFADGSTSSCDVLIGSDGIKSAVRRSMVSDWAARAKAEGKTREAEVLMEKIEPRWTGIVAYRALIPTERLAAYKDAHPEEHVRVPQQNSIPIMYMGQNVNVVVYPISSGRLINIGAFHAREELAGTQFPGPSVTNVETEELLEIHKDWEDELKAILRCVEKPSRWAIHASKPLPTWVSENVALLGDAAHAMSPQQASGAGQAIEDAYILCTLLAHPLTTRTTTSRALRIYDTIRRPIAEEIAERALLNGRLFGLQLPEHEDLAYTFNARSSMSSNDPRVYERFHADRHPERLGEVGEAIKANWRWAWATSAEAPLREAVRRLEAEAGVVSERAMM
ncbi:hypothetical protein HGRIS_005361 [Hohenbuehelia grisea]|uniref:FAD-binding domain-containing protein n=1 Tax=Hohenbuehelia grisea TaxID=104357 RepID=A0ABR3JFV0_9AGAR